MSWSICIFLYLSLERNPTNSLLKLFSLMSFSKTMALEPYFFFFFQSCWEYKVFAIWSKYSLLFCWFNNSKLLSTVSGVLVVTSLVLGGLDFEETFWKVLFHKGLSMCLLMPTIMIQAVAHNCDFVPAPAILSSDSSSQFNFQSH